MIRKAKKRSVLGIMTLICLLLTSLQLPQGTDKIYAAGEQGGGVLYREDFESVQENEDVTTLEEWSFVPASGSSEPTAQTNVESFEGGKVLCFDQKGNDSALSGNPTLRTALGGSYDNIELSFDVRANQTSGKLDIALGTAADTNQWMRTLLSLNGGKLMQGSTQLGVYTVNEWHQIRIVYKRTGDGVRSYDTWFDNQKVSADVSPTADVAVSHIIWQLYRGIVGSFYIDNIVVKEAGAGEEESTDTNAAVYVGMDQETKADWETSYGTKQAILLGAAYTGEVTYEKYAGIYNRFTLAANQYDYYRYFDSGKDDLITHVGNYGGNMFAFPAEESGGKALNVPADVVDKGYNAYAMNGWTSQYASNPNCPNAGYAIQGSNYRTAHTFTLPEGKTYVFSVYSNNGLNNTGDVIFTLLTPENEILTQETMAAADFDGGAYATFLVRGSFKLYIDKTKALFGVNGFFFEEAGKNFTSGLTAEAGEEARSIKLSWTETDPGEDAEVVLYRKKAEDTQWIRIAAVAAGAAGTGSYLDRNLEAGETYSYKVRTVSGGQYSYFGQEAEYTVSAYEATVMTTDRAEYTVADTNQEAVITAVLKKADGTACAGQQVSLTVNWKFDASVIQNIGESTTDQNGQAVFRFRPEYLGEAQLELHFADNDEDRLQNSSATALLFVGEKQWAKAPVLYRISDAVMPGELISLYGYGMCAEEESALTVKFAPHLSETVSSVPPANAVQLEIVQTDPRNGYYTVAAFPESAAPGVYDVWVSNEAGFSSPITLNAARPLFMSEYEAWAGQQIEVSGRAMDAGQFGCNTETRVRLAGGNGSYEQNVDKYSPYSLTFTVGQIPLGEYRVEISNDSGRTWTALASSQTLTVVEKGQDPLGLGVAWMDHFAWENVFDVTAYGALGTDTADDTAAITAALTAAKESAAGGGVVYLPKGNYYITTLDIPAGIVLLGEDTQETVLTYCGENEKVNMIEGTQEDRTEGHLGFARFSIRLADETKRPDSFFWLGHDWDASNSNVKLRTASEIFLYEVNLTYGFDPIVNNCRGLGVVLIGNERFIMQDCRFEGLAACPQYVKSNFYGTYRGNTFVYEKGAVQNMAAYTFMEDNHLTARFGEKEDSEYLYDSHGLFGRDHVHMENNYVEKMGSMKTSTTAHAWANDGETYCVEPSVTLSYGDVINSSGDSITVKLFAAQLKSLEEYTLQYGRLAVVIHDGRGMGQMRDVTAMDKESGKITVNKEWDVLPDSTSKFTFTLPLDGVTIYNNEDADSAKGVYLYGCGFDSVVANHKSTNTEGIYVHSAQVYNGTSDRVWTAYYTAIRDNEITGISARTQDGKIAVGTERSIAGANYYGVSTYATEIRNNTITGIKGSESTGRTEGCPESGIVSMSSRGKANADNVAGDTTCLIAEGNQLTAQDVGITYSLSDYGIVLANNSFEDCTANTQQYLPTQTDQQAVTEHITIRNTEVATAVFRAYQEMLNTRNREKYTDETAQRLAAAIAQADLAVTDAEFRKALRELKTAYTGLKWKSGKAQETAEGYTAGITAGQSEYAIGDTIYIPVAVSHSENTAFHAAEIKVSYDAEVMAFDANNSILNEAAVKAEKGILTLEDYGAEKAFGESVYVLAFEALKEVTASDITLTAAAFSDAENAKEKDLEEAQLSSSKVTLTITKAPLNVTLDRTMFTGESKAAYGKDYTFGLTENGEYYDYVFNATMEDENGNPVSVTVADNGNGTYTIVKVTGDLVITATRTAKSYGVSFAGTGGEETGKITGNKTTAAYGTDYRFLLPETTDDYIYAVESITIGGAAYTGYTIQEGEGTVTIAGADIKGDLVITVSKTEIPPEYVTVTVEGNGAGHATYETTAQKKKAYTLTLNRKAGYVYEVTAKMADAAGVYKEAELSADGDRYTIARVTGNVIFTIQRSLDTTGITVSEEPYLKLQGTNMWLVLCTTETEDGETLAYDGGKMFWSEKYNDGKGAYCYLVIADSLDAEEAKSRISIVTGTKLSVDYGMDVNITGKVDANDAQLVYNMYNAKYNAFTERNTGSAESTADASRCLELEKFLRADVNVDRKITVEDAAAIIYGILNPGNVTGE